MPFDPGLASRVQDLLQAQCHAQGLHCQAKKMFGGLCLMVNQHMCCGIVGDTLMARVGPEQYTDCLAQPHAREMDFTGRAMKGMVYIDPAGFEEDQDLMRWLQRCLAFVLTLPPKKPKAAK